MDANLAQIGDIAAKLAAQLESNRDVTKAIAEKARLLQVLLENFGLFVA